jgi:hypothetical protein
MRNRTSKMVTRRTFIKQSGALGLTMAARGTALKPLVSEEDHQFLEELERANYLYFWEQASPRTGLVRDRCNVRGNDHGVR